MKTILIILALLAGCSINIETKRKSNEYNAKQAMESVVFVKHKGTNLCFAYNQPDSANASQAFTEVSCEKVEKFLVN